MNFRLKLLACAMAAIPVAAFAIGGPSGPKIDYHVQGHLGEVMMNPYGIAPLTAIVRDGGYTVKDVTVRVLPKPDGREIKYKVSDRQVGVNAPPFHPRCRTTAIPYISFGKENAMRAARDKDGEYVKVPESMTYAEWERKFTR